MITADQLIQKMKKDSQESFGLTHDTLITLKKFLEEAKNALNNQNVKQPDLLLFKQKMVGYIINTFSKGNPSSKDKILMLEILQRDLISSKHNVNLFNKLYMFLLEQDENVAIQASKTVDALIKQINQSAQQSPGAVPLQIKNHYIKLFQFLKEKTQFLLKLSEHTKCAQFNVYRRQAYEQRQKQKDKQKQKQKQKREIVFKNNKSLKFINQVPHLFIHLMAYVDTSNRNTEQDNKIKQLIRKSIENIIQALKRTPYEEFYNQFNYEFNNQLFAVMTKLLQFLFINLRTDKDTSNNTRSNQNLKKNIADQVQFIKVPQVIKNFIHLLKNCSQDFQLNRYQIVNRLKLLLTNLDKNKLNKHQAIQIMNQILNEETIFGRKKILGDYSKNAICSYWIQIIRSNVLINNIFPQNILSLRAASQNPSLSDQNKQSKQITECFNNIQKLFEEVLKTIFDNSIYPSVQQKCIDLIIFLLDQLFPDGLESNQTLPYSNPLGAPRKIHENKLKIMLKVLHAVSLKFLSIRHTFQEIDDYITSKLGHKATKKDLPEPLKLNHMQLSSLNVTTQEQNWQSKFDNFIQNYNQDIDSSLLTLTAVQNRFLTIYQEDDQLCFNSHPVRKNNYTLYMKEVKTKLLQKCITLSNKITKTFLIQNLQSYNQIQFNSLKTIYYSVINKKYLTNDQCKILATILKNGLKIFQILHNYDIHSDQQTNKRGHLKNFMLIFAQIYDPVNFRDIFQPNMNQFFRNLIVYAKHCSQFCLQHVLIQPYCSNQNQSQQNPQQFNKNIVQLLTYNLILRLESTSDQLDPFHDFYDYKQEYFLLLQKLIRFPFRCLSRYADDSFIRNYFRQIILFLTKKAHNSRFCLDYLHLMRTLFKNILFNSNRQSASPLFQQFYAICCKTNTINPQIPSQSSSSFVNVNILQNFLKFFDTGIPQLSDIVTELVIMLPLKSKHIIQFAKQGYIVKPLLHCLCLMSDYNYLLRTLKTFQIIISHSSAEQINSFLEGVKDKLINRLFEMVINQYKSSDLKPQKINNDLSSLSLKLLAKLGCLSRNRDLTLQLKQRTQKQIPQNFDLVFKSLQTSKQFTLSLIPSIQYSLQLFHKLLDSYYQSVVYISMQMIQKCFSLLIDTLPIVLQKMHPLAQKIIAVFTSILALSSKYLTISQSILNRIRQDVKNSLTQQYNKVKQLIKKEGLKQFSKFFIKCMIQNLNQRVLITREDNFIKQISQQPKKFIWQKLLNLMEENKQNIHYHDIYLYVVKLLISQIVMIKNNNHVYLNNYQKDYNYVLPFKNAALSSMNQLIDILPQNVLQQCYPDILNSLFIVVGTLPDILNLKISRLPQTIACKIYKFILRDQQKFMKQFKTQKGQQVFSCILQNLVSYSIQAHKISKIFLQMIMNQTKLKLHELLYGAQSWDQICDTTSKQSRSQAKYLLSDFNHKDKQIYNYKYPIIQLIKNLLRVSHNINDQCLKNDKILKILTNTFSTFQLLISIKCGDQYFQAFQILKMMKQCEQLSQENVMFTQTFKKIINISQDIIAINSKLYQSYAKIIIEQPNNPNVQNPNQPNASNIPNRPPQNPQNPNVPPRVRQGPHPVPIGASSQTFNINTNTFIDDQEYGLNIQDLDLDVKTWGNLVASILKFLKTVLVNKNVFTNSKNMLKRRIQRSKLIQLRLQIIFSMFDLIGRVDRNVRDTAYQCLDDLLKREDHPKELINNDQKLKHILRPVLISLQLQFKKFTPSFLIMFKKILKLLTQCFNITLIQKLIDKLRQMQKSRDNDPNSVQNRAAIVPNPPPGVKYMNYSQITNQVKCIASFLGLFQHLAYAYHNHRSQNYTVNSVMMIFKYITNISKFFIPKLGKHTISVYIKKTLAKVFNTMCEKLSGQAIFVTQNHERELDYQNFLQLIQLQQSFPLREKLTRQTSYIEKTFFLLRQQKRKEYYIFLQIIYTLAKRSNKWLKNFASLAQKLSQELENVIEYKCKKFQQRRQNQRQFNERNQLILLSKILLEYCKQNTEDIKILFRLVYVYKVRSTFDLHFLRRYLKYQLYYKISPNTHRNIMVQFLKLLKQPHNYDAQRVLSISQNIIYYLILIQVNKPIQQRSIIINDQQIMRSIAQTIKICLNSKNLYIKGNQHLTPRQISYNYRIGIEVLQITNLMLGAYKNIIPEQSRNNMLVTIWGLLRIQDKIIKNYAFVWTSNYIKVFEGFDNTRALGLYLTLIRGLEGLSQGDFEIGALIKKSLNILIPYWDNKPPNTNGNWIEWSLKAVHQQANQPNRLVRFWQIVVKNHKIFHKFKQTKFQTQMVNSMQWLMVANNPTSTNPLIKKIASDMSFIYIEWKFSQAQQKLKQKKVQIQNQQNKNLEQSNKQSNTDRAAQICLNFFIKVALNNSNDKDDKQIMKRSLYLLKKTLILWPNTKKKFQSIKVIVTKLKSAQNATNPLPEMPLRFHYTLLNIIHILMLYQSDAKLLPQLTMIFKLLELGGPTNQVRYPPTSHPQPQGNTIFTMNNIYLLNLLCQIIKRLVKISIQNQSNQQSQKLMQQIHQYIRDGFEYYVLSANRNRTSNPQPRNIPMKKIQIQVAVSFLKILYEMDSKLIESHLNYIKQVTATLKKMFEKGFQTSSKNNNPSRVFQLPSLTQQTFQQMLNKDLLINVELIKQQNLTSYQQNYQKQNIKSYATRRPLFLVLIRILAVKFNSITHNQDRTNTLDIFISIYEKIPDPQLKLQVINILKCMFIGKTAFKDNVIPNIYKDIQIINYPTKKIFFLLFEDNHKFNQHFERRKSKPSDQNYNINERIYEEITTKVYFNFLCTFIIHLQKNNELKPQYLNNVIIFILYAVKIVQADLIEQIFHILDKSYQGNSLQLYSSLFQSYKQLNCAEQYLQGDQIMVFFTSYLYKKAITNYSISTNLFGQQSMIDFHNHFINFLKVQQFSQHHIKNITNSFRLSIKLLPHSNRLPRVLRQYLLQGSYNEVWGSILLKIANQNLKCLNAEDMLKISTKINQWGLLLKYLEQQKTESCYTILDSVYKAYGDKDLQTGFRMLVSDNNQLQNALALLQQRKYVDTLKIINQLENNKLKRMIVTDDSSQMLQQRIASLQQLLQQNHITDISKECYKNLDKWDQILQERNQPLDMQGKIDYLFHSKGNKQKITSILNHLDFHDNRHFPYFYGKSVIHFLQSNSTNPIKQLNVSLLFSLLEWLSFPKNAIMNQNKMLVKIQCLLELQQGQKIKQQSLTSNSEHSSLVDALTKVVQSVYTQINSWRQRMPYKYEDMATWHAILGQRIMIFEFMKNKMQSLLDSVLKSSNQNTLNIQNATQRLLIPYTDIQWNKLKLLKQQRAFGIYNQNNSNQGSLYLDQVFIKEKQKFYYAFEQQKDHPKALSVIQNALKQIVKEQGNHRDDQLIKIQRIQLARLKAKVYVQDQCFEQANQIYLQNVKGVQHHLLSLWRDWMTMSIKAYEKTKNINWAKSALAVFPYALRYKYKKTRLLLSPIFNILKENANDDAIFSACSNISLESIPYKYLILWIPQLIKLCESNDKISPIIVKILTKISILFPEIIYFIFKPLFKGVDLKNLRQTYVNMKRSSYNLVTKLQYFNQGLLQIKNPNNNQDSVSISTMSFLSKCFSEIHVPLYQNYRGDFQQSMIPCIVQISERIQKENFNGIMGQVLTFLGSDGKQYRYRLQRNQKTDKHISSLQGVQYKNMIGSQLMQIAHSQLGYWKQSAIRKLKLFEIKKIYLQDDLALVKSSKSYTSMYQILNNNMKKLKIDQINLQTDKQLSKLSRDQETRNVNKRMKKMIPKNLMKEYFIQKSASFDQFNSFRRVFSYQYGTVCSLYYILGLQIDLQNLIFDMKTGIIHVNNLKLNFENEKLSPYSLRLSRNILQFLDKTLLNGGILPSFAATIDAFNNQKFNFKSYVNMIHKDLQTMSINQEQRQNKRQSVVSQRLDNMNGNLYKIRKIIQVAEKIAYNNDVPINLKYWF